MKKLYSILAVAALAFTANAQIVINEVYGGGGNSGATLTHDYVELYNRGTTSITLSNAYIQYAGVTSTFSAGNMLALPVITLEPGQYYLIQLAKGNGGNTALPTPDYIPTGTSAISVGGSGGKIALTTNNTPVTSATSSNVIDFVGWGAADMSEGTPAAGTSNTTSVSRINGADTNVNSNDFKVGAPSPTNSKGQTLGVKEQSMQENSFIDNTVVSDKVTFSKTSNIKIYSAAGQLFKAAAVEKGNSLDVSSLPKGIYIVTGDVDGHTVSQKIIKR